MRISDKFSCNLSISFVQNIFVLDKPRKIFSCVKADYENKKQLLLNLSIQFFIDAQGLLLIGRKDVHYVEVCMYLEHEQHFVFKC